jgi:hypothetical protein
MIAPEAEEGEAPRRGGALRGIQQAGAEPAPLPGDTYI